MGNWIHFIHTIARLLKLILEISSIENPMLLSKMNSYTDKGEF